ncbi:hypothetical protein Ahy_B03g066147 [Arachis hypogaea]|uniref:Uncharacterized protein n=1 Tax=Arachis hypogaea TaxID=3818 RepID=A0A445A3I8_ARAHY|nr:hypothetical protein Ahy_B03g066147 [Arachis hypogaea]
MSGLFALVDKYSKLKSMNIWGTRVPVDSLKNLLITSPTIQIKL